MRVKTPEQALKLASQGAVLGYREGVEIKPVGEISKITRTGKTIITTKGATFNFNEAKGSFRSKTGSDIGDVVVLTPAELRRVNRRIYMRKYMKGYLANMSERKKKARRKYMRDYMKQYQAERRAVAKRGRS
jgi:hypothetical protein